MSNPQYLLGMLLIKVRKIRIKKGDLEVMGSKRLQMERSQR